VSDGEHDDRVGDDDNDPKANGLNSRAFDVIKKSDLFGSHNSSISGIHLR